MKQLRWQRYLHQEKRQEKITLNTSDAISVNGDHLIYDAKQAVLALANAGYLPPAKVKFPVVGETGYAALLLGANSMHLSGYISEHDLKIAKALAYVIAGGKVPLVQK